MKPFFSLVLGNIGSKVVGVAREIVFAALFGTSSVAAAYRLSQMALYAPTHALVLETVSGGLLPLYRRSLHREAEERQALVIVAAATSLAVSLAIGLALMIFNREIVLLLARDADVATITLSISMIRLMGVAVPLYVLGNLVTFIETAHGHYGGISWRPTLLNVTTLGAAGLAAWFHAPIVLATGALLSHALFLAWSLTYALRRKIVRFWLPKGCDLYRAAMRSYLLNSLPLLMLPLIGQLVLIVERIIAGRIGTAVIVGVDYARFITDTVLALTSVPLGLIMLSQEGGRRDEQSMQSLRSRTLLLITIAGPAGFFLSCNATDIVKIVFARGAFKGDSILAVAPILLGMGWGLGATVASYFELKALNAQLRNVAAVLITGVAGLGNLTVDLLLWQSSGPLALGLGVSAYGLIAFVLSTTVLGMWRSLVAPIVACLGVLVALGLAALLSAPLHSPLLRVMVSGTIALTAWLGLFLTIPATRALILTLVDRLRKRRGSSATT